MQEVAEVVGIPVEDVERINTAWWKFVSEMMARPEMPRIKMDYLCVLYPSAKKLYHYCEYMGKVVEKVVNKTHTEKYDNMVGNIGNVVKHLQKLQDTYFRLESEKGIGKMKMSEEKKEELSRKKLDRVPDIKIVELEKIKLLNSNNDVD